LPQDLGMGSGQTGAFRIFFNLVNALRNQL
jgi:hypothetical protein